MMRIFWASPHGDGWSMAAKLRDLGNKVVVWSPNSNNGAGLVPLAPATGWQALAERADAVIVDGTFPSRRTRRSFSPSDELLDLLQIVRKTGAIYIGPVATTELIENDRRYRAKILRRFGLGIDTRQQTESVELTLSTSQRSSYLVFRTKSDIQMGDIVLPAHNEQPCLQLIQPFKKFVEDLGHTSYLNLKIRFSKDFCSIEDVTTSFLYPASVVQLPDLLGLTYPSEEGSVGLAQTLIADSSAKELRPSLFEASRFFGVEIDREGDGLHLKGPIIGAIGVQDRSWPLVNQQLEHELADWGLSNGFLNSDIDRRLHQLSSWGYL